MNAAYTETLAEVRAFIQRNIDSIDLDDPGSHRAYNQGRRDAYRHCLALIAPDRIRVEDAQ